MQVWKPSLNISYVDCRINIYRPIKQFLLSIVCFWFYLLVAGAGETSVGEAQAVVTWPRRAVGRRVVTTATDWWSVATGLVAALFSLRTTLCLQYTCKYTYMYKSCKYQQTYVCIIHVQTRRMTHIMSLEWLTVNIHGTHRRKRENRPTNKNRRKYELHGMTPFWSSVCRVSVVHVLDPLSFPRLSVSQRYWCQRYPDSIRLLHSLDQLPHQLASVT